MTETTGRLTGKVAIVTGAGSQGPGIGNGRAISVLLAREGARVLLVDNVQERAEETAAMVHEDGGDAVVYEADVSDPRACEAAVSRAVAQWGRLDILVNNVGIMGPTGTVVDISLADWDRVIRVNLSSMMLMSKYSVPQFRNNDGGCIINISSTAGIRGGSPYLCYATVKGAIIQMTRALAAHHGREGIRVNCVAPGMVSTPLHFAITTPEAHDMRRRRFLLARDGTAWDVAYGVLYLASDEASWVTGQTITIDGGMTAGTPLAPQTIAADSPESM